MSGQPHGPVATLMTPEQASKLLDEVVYERVLGFFDLDALHELEQDLCLALCECGLDGEAAIDTSKQMIDRAIARIGDDPRRYFRFGRPDDSPFGDCELCEEEAVHAAVRPNKRRAS